MKRLKAFWMFIRPFVFFIFKSASVPLAEAAIRAVRVAESKHEGSDGELKRERAYAEIVGDLESQGVQIADNLIHAAIEAAVARMKRTGKP